jgi:signal peptidase I
MSVDGYLEKQRDFEKTTVPEGHCFVLGDNRDLSLDSRHFGSIPLDSIIGKSDIIFNPKKIWLGSKGLDSVERPFRQR